MGEQTHISWCDHTFNPWIGCTRVSPACDACYAENLMATRYGRVVWGAPGAGNGTRERTSAGNWAKPRTWDRKAAAAGTRPFVFCASLADVFDNQVDPAWRLDLFDLIRATPHLVWLLLTKRPQNIVRLFREALQMSGGAEYTAQVWPRNAAIGCTVVTQAEWDRDRQWLMAAKASLDPAFAFLSMEPLLGEVWIDLKTSGARPDWIITGGETDQGAHKARPQNPDWFRSLRDQCAAAGVAFHHKQNGEYLDGQRVGRAVAGRLLDGLVHDGRPINR